MASALPSSQLHPHPGCVRSPPLQALSFSQRGWSGVSSPPSAQLQWPHGYFCQRGPSRWATVPARPAFAPVQCMCKAQHNQQHVLGSCQQNQGHTTLWAILCLHDLHGSQVMLGHLDLARAPRAAAGSVQPAPRPVDTQRPGSPMPATCLGQTEGTWRYPSSPQSTQLPRAAGWLGWSLSLLSVHPSV